MSEHIQEPKRFPSKATPERAWFDDDATGYHAEIALDGQSFQIREVSEVQIKAFSAGERRTALALQAVANEQTKAVEAAKKRKQKEDAAREKAEALGTPLETEPEETGQLSDAQTEEYARRSDELLAQQFANSDELLIASLVGWSLPRELTPENIVRLSKSARRRLAELVGQRSTLGADEQSFLAQRSRK